MGPAFRILLLLLSGVALSAQSAKTVSLNVRETAGIRRMGYPVNARVPFPKGTLASAADARLVSAGDSEVPAQFSAESRWPDSSIQWLDVDFNVSLGSLETQTYLVDYGPGVKPKTVARGLAISQDAETIQVGSVKFSKAGAPLVLSVKYRGEDIAPGQNGIAVVDAAGASHELTKANPPKVEIVKPGPLYVVLRYSGRMSIDANYRVPYTIRVEMPNSKSWVKITASVDDPERRLRELAFNSPLAFGPMPWVWDFGTDRWTYGSLRNAMESVSLVQKIMAQGASDWHVNVGPKGQEQLFESGVPESKFVRWGHIQDAKEVVAFGMEIPERQAGTSAIVIGGDGQASFRFAPSTPVTQHRLTVYQHFVNTPVQIGAVTTASSMLSPLISMCDRQQYMLSGVDPPRD